MILAAGLTPAWQKIMRFRQIEVGAVNRAAQVDWCASGKVLNVGMALAALGADSHTLSPAGGASGAALRREFARRKIAATWTPAAAPTRTCTTLLNEATRECTELVEQAAALTDAERKEFIDAYRRLVKSADLVVLTGSMPALTPTAFYHSLVKRTRCPVILDARGGDLRATLEFRPRVVKPNRQELADTVERELPDRQAVLAAMRQLIVEGAQSVVVTQGTAPVLVMEGKKIHELMPLEVSPVVNPIGCGDCLAAGIAIGLARGDSLVDAVLFGMAAAAENATKLLPARLTAWANDLTRSIREAHGRAV